jgi:hypothetical protein
MKTKRIRVPLSDEDGYDPFIISKKFYVVVSYPPYPLRERTFADYADALDFYEQHEGVRLEEVLAVFQIKTILPINVPE